MLRKLMVIATVAAIAVAGYAMFPLVAAWQIREAVRTGDVVRLAEMVDWPAVRQSLKHSVGDTRAALSELTDAAGLPRPGLWQRLKAAALPYVADPLIDRYVTAEGVPQLYAWRQSLKQKVTALRQAARASTEMVAASVAPEPRGWIEMALEATPLPRILAAARRIERWAFVSPVRLEIELADRVVPDRRWQAEMQLRGLAWRLTGMKVMTARRPPTSAARGARATAMGR